VGWGFGCGWVGGWFLLLLSVLDDQQRRTHDHLPPIKSCQRPPNPTATPNPTRSSAPSQCQRHCHSPVHVPAHVALQVAPQSLAHQIVRLLLLVHVVERQALHRQRLAMLRELFEDLVCCLDRLFVLLALVQLHHRAGCVRMRVSCCGASAGGGWGEAMQGRAGGANMHRCCAVAASDRDGQAASQRPCRPAQHNCGTQSYVSILRARARTPRLCVQAECLLPPAFASRSNTHRNNCCSLAGNG